MKQLLKNYLLLDKLKSTNRILWICGPVLVLSSFMNGQIINYVSNGSFEGLSSTTITSFYSAADFWQPIDTGKYAYLLYSTKSGINTAPYCGQGFQQPRSGQNFIAPMFYCSSCPYYSSRSYPRNRLKDKLEAGHTYCAKYYVVNTNNTTLANDSYGIYFGNSLLDTINYCNGPITHLSPQIQSNLGIITDTLTWIAITGTFVANGDEKYMVLGNFKSNAATNTLLINPANLPALVTDIYVDDVSCIDLALSAYAGEDSFLPPGDSAFVGRPPDVGIDEACTWYKLPNLSVPIATIAGMWVKPITTTTYVVRQEICGNVKWDTVVVYESGVGIEAILHADERIKIYPIPTKDELTLQILDNKLHISHYSVYNQFGQILREEVVHLDGQKIVIKTTNLPRGIYQLVLKKDQESIAKRRFVVTD